MIPLWLRQLLGRRLNSSPLSGDGRRRNRLASGGRPTPIRRNRKVPALELLEDRCTPALSTPLHNFDGISFTGVFPGDGTGDVGLNHYVQAVNGSSGTRMTIYDKTTGTPVAGFNNILMNSLVPGVNAGAGDPNVIYDQLANRWILADFSADVTNAMSIFVSQTPDPTGAWFHYDVAAPGFPDYFKIGVMPDAYYISANEGSGSRPVYALNRTKMLAGQALGANDVQRKTAPTLAGFGFQAFTPGDNDGAAAPAGAGGLFMRHRDDEAHNPGTNNPAQDFLEVWQFTVDFATPANSTFAQIANIPVAEFDSNINGLFLFEAFPQPNGQKLDPLREVIMNRLQYRNFGTYEVLVGNYVTDVAVDQGGVRWFELRKVGAGSWTLFQEGTVAPDAHNRWMGAISMNGSGNIALAYSITSPTVFPGLRYVGRLAGDILGTMPDGEHTLVNGSSSQSSFNRWGDYFSMNVDPVDDRTFWYVGTYMPAGGQWRTRIGAFQFGDRFEPNDTFAAATDLGSPLTRTENNLNIHDPNNDDYYRVTAAGNGDLTVNLSFLNAQGNVDLFVYNASQTQIGSSTTTGNGESVTVPVTAGQNYFIKVAGASSATNPDYDLSLSLVPFPDRFEPNNSFAAATDLGTLGSRVENDLTIHAPNNDDYYRLTAAAIGSLTVNLSFLNAQGNVDLFVYDAAQVEIGRSTTTSNTESVSVPVTAGQTYYVKVVGAGGALSLDYDMSLNLVEARDRFEPNDSFAAAAYLGTLGIHTESGLSVHAINNDDYYYLTAAAKGSLTVSLSFLNAQGNLDLYVYDATQAQIGSSTTTTNNESVTITVAAGQTYFIKVIGFGGATNPNYDMTITGPGTILTNPATITIPGFGAATPYPSTINASGLVGTIDKVMVTLTNFNHAYPADVDILLVSPLGQKLVLLSDAGGSNPASNVTLRFDDSAPTGAPDTAALAPGIYKPTDFQPGDVFPAPAPAGPATGTTLAIFNGMSPNGTWSLYVADDLNVIGGSIGGWSLLIVSTDKSLPSVQTLSPADGAAITTANPNIDVTFSEVVVGVDASDMVLTGTAAGGATVGTPTNISGNTWRFPVSGLASTGTLNVALAPDLGDILDTDNNNLAPRPTTWSYSVDTVVPLVQSINRTTPVGPATNATSVVYTVTFTESVSNVDAADFSLALSGVTTTPPLVVSGSGTTYTVTVNGIAGTGTLGLNLTDNDSITDAAGNPLGGAGLVNGDFTGQVYNIDTGNPTVDITDVSPDPRNNAVPSITIVFSEAVTGFDVLGDLSLTRDGSPVALTGATLNSGDNITWTLANLTGLTGAAGNYLLTLTAAGSGIQDSVGNPLVAGATDAWFLDTVAPTVDIIDVTPDPRGTSVASITIRFSEAVTGFDVLGDLSLTRNGGGNLLTGTESLTSTDGGITWTLGNLATLTAAAGDYLLTLTAAGSGIQDVVGNALMTDATDAWLTDTTPPTADVVDVSPDPRNNLVDTITIQFTELVNGFDLADLSLTRNGGANLLSGAQTLITSDNVTWTLSNLAGLTSAAGNYLLTVTAFGSGIVDIAGNPLAGNANDAWVMDLAAPTVDILDVTPDPRNNAVSSITIVFSEVVTDFDIADLSLRRDASANLLTVAQTLNSSDGGITWVLGNLVGLTSTAGSYLLTLTAAGSGIQDSAANLLVTGATESWVTDLTAPTVDILDVTPDPRSSGVASITVQFSEAVTGFDLADLALRRDGGANLLTGAQTLSTSDSITWTLGNLSGLTGVAGNYLLSLTAAGSNIRDLATNALTAGATDAWGVDTIPPTMDIVDVSPDPRTTSIGSITIVFSEAITNFDLADLSLTRDGGANLLTGSQTLTTANNITWTLGNLAGLTGQTGSYLLTATAAGIQDGAGNVVVANATDAWVTDMTPPTVDILDVSPDPRNTNVASITIQFSEAITGFNLADLSLTRNSVAILLTGAQTLSTTDNVTWTLGNLSGLTGTAGNYLLTLTAAGSGIQDNLGNVMTTSASDAWTVDVTAPTVDILDVTRDPRNTSVPVITIQFSEAVTGLDLADLSLTRDGGANLLTGAQTLMTSDSISWILGNLDGLTGLTGNYLLTLTAAGSGIQDLAANVLATGASDAWVVDSTAPTVDILDVTPDPANSAVTSITIQFSEAITGFDLADLSLRRNGGGNLLTGAQTLTTSNNVTWVLGNLGGLTGVTGNYQLTLTAAGSSILDAVDNPLAGDATDLWAIDVTPPTVDIQDVSPDPRSTSVSSVTIQFSEAITNFDLADLSLTRNGSANLLTGAQTLTTANNITWTLDNLAGLTNQTGNYLLTVIAAGIQDGAGNAVTANATDAWAADMTAPTVDIQDVSPDPRNGSVSSIVIQFSEAVTGFNLADLSLTRNGSTNLLTGAQTLTSLDGITWTLGNVASLTGSAGNYQLGLTATGSGIQDNVGNALTVGATDAWAVDLTLPTVDILDVSPDPRNTSVGSITIQFSEAVTNFDLADLSLTRSGSTNLLTGAQTLGTTDNVTWTLGNLASLTGSAGNYALTLTATGSGIQDTASNPLGTNATDTWVTDTLAPTADILDVTPDPRNGSVGSITIQFSEPVSNFDLADLVLQRDGGANLLTGAQTLTTTDNVTWALNNLSGLTSAAGNYALTLTAAGSGIQDNVGNVMTTSATDSWVTDTTPPTVDVLDVSPDPRNTSVASIAIQFSEAVAGFDLADLSLTRNGSANLLTGAETLSTTDNVTWTLSNLTGLTSVGGNYVLTVTAFGSGIQDAAGNALSGSASDAWVMDTVAPTVDILNVTPDPRNNGVGSITIQFSEPVTGFNLADLSLQRDGGASLLTVAQTPTSGDGITWTLGNLTGLTTPQGNYLLTLTAALSGIQDSVGNALTVGATDDWTVDTTPPTVVLTSSRSALTNSSPIVVTATFSESVTGFTIGDVAVVNANVSNFTGSGAVYNFTLTPLAAGLVTANISAAAALDLSGNASTAAAPLQHTYLPAIQILGAPATGLEGSAIPLTAGNQPAGFGFEWEVARNGILIVRTNGPTFNFVPPDEGTYLIQLVSIDPDGGRGNPVTRTITVDNVAPTVLDVIGRPVNGKATGRLTLTAVVREPGQDQLTFTWSFTLARPGKRPKVIRTLSGRTVAFNPRAGGLYSVTVTVTDEDGARNGQFTFNFRANQRSAKR